MITSPLSSNMPSLLEARDLVKRFRVRQSWTTQTNVTALDQLSLQIGAGQTVALVGESGCGKTTAGKILLGLVEPDAGVIFFRGQPLAPILAQSSLEYRRAVQMVFQNPLASFNPMLTIGATLLDALRLRPKLDQAARQSEVARLLQRVGLERDFAQRYPSDMSGGQLQRVGVARALASQPKLLFLDEPTSALDMSVRGQIINLLLSLQRDEHLAYLLVSHDLSVVRIMAHTVLVMYLGQVVEEGPAVRVLSQPRHPYTQGLLAATRLGQLQADTSQRPLRVRGEVLQLPPKYRGCKLTRRCPFEVTRCQQEPQSLESVDVDHRVRCWRWREIESYTDER